MSSQGVVWIVDQHRRRPGSGHRDEPVTLLGTPTQIEGTSVSSAPEDSCSP